MKFISVLSLFKIVSPLTHKIWSTGLAGLDFLLSLLKTLDPRPRLGLSIMLGMLVFLLLPSEMSLDTRVLAAWTLGILCFLTLVLFMMSSATPQKTRYRAQRQEAQHSAVFLAVIITACTSIFAIGLMQTNNENVPGTELVIEVVLSMLAVLCSWFVTHTTFALHYATLYYRKEHLLLAANLTTYAEQETAAADEEYAGGLDFPSEEIPDYWDFMYFAFTLGMTAQTSDVSITSVHMRHLVLGHALISFFFYMVILASSINIASGLI